MKLIKLTDKNGQTYGGTQWGENVTHEVTWSDNFCSPGCIHVYQDLHVALFLNPIHANFNPVQAWEAEGDILKSDNGLKFGVAKLTTLRKLKLPKITKTNRIAFGILCALEVYKKPKFMSWTESWLNGKNRTLAAEAEAEAWAARASSPKKRSDLAAWAAARAAVTREAETAAWAAARAAVTREAETAARAAARAAVTAPLDLPILAQRAMLIK